MSNAQQSTKKYAALFNESELILLAHFRMRKFSVQSALEKMQRTDVSVQEVNAAVASKYKNWDKFFEALGPKVHEQREKHMLPEVKTPKRKPKNERFFFGYTSGCK